MTDATLHFSQIGQIELDNGVTFTLPKGRTLFAIQVEEEMVISGCVWAPGYDGPTWVDRVLLAGQIYYGRWSDVTVDTGHGIGHYA